MRLRLAWPSASFPFMGEGPMTPETYLTLLTMHGTIMVFFVLTTAPQGGFGNYVLPIQIGAADMAFPFLNMMSFWTTLLGLFVTAILMLLSFAVLLAAGILLLMDRELGTSFFIPAGLVISEQVINHKGG